MILSINSWDGPNVNMVSPPCVGYSYNGSTVMSTLLLYSNYQLTSVMPYYLGGPTQKHN